MKLDGQPTPPEAVPSFDAFVPPVAYYRFQLEDEALVDDKYFRGYTVQYNESDLDVFSRLVEEMGISYVYEHAADGVVLTLTDRPGREPHDARDRTVFHRGSSDAGHGRDQEVVRSFREGRRLRSRAVAMRDFTFRRALTPNEAAQHVDGIDDEEAELSEHYEFPAREETVDDQPCVLATRVRLERFQIERSLSEGSSTVRTLEPGCVYLFRDDEGHRPETRYLVSRVETWATQLAISGTELDRRAFGVGGRGQGAGILENEFEVAPASLRYRPAIVTAHPRIDGVQSAIVTAEEVSPEPEINSDPSGRVRVRFPWDRRPPDGAPTSGWVRVSQVWAGAGFGGMYVPRVGHEVLVAYLQGDPERPVVVGRVYNVQRPPPYDFEERKTVSTVKSHSSPDAEGFNELRFEDKKRHEQIYLHAQKDLDETVRNNHSTSVGADQSNRVGGDRTHEVEKTETVTVHGDRTTRFLQSENHYVELTRETDIGTGEILRVHATRTTDITDDDAREVHGTDFVRIGGTRDVITGGDHTVRTTGHYTSVASSNHVFQSSNTYVSTGPGGDGSAGQIHLLSGHLETWQQQYVKLHVGPNHVEITPGSVELKTDGGARVALSGGNVTIAAPGGLVVNGATVQIHATGGTMTLDASTSVNIEAKGGDVNAKGSTNVKLNC